MAGLTSLFVTRDASSNGTTPKGARHALGGLLLQAGDALLNARKGVLMDAGGDVVSGKADMSFDVRAAAFVGQSSTAQGPWLGVNDAVVNVTTDPAPGTNSRYDIVCVRQHLVAGDGGVDTDVILEFFVEQGVVAASPSVPATPAGAIKLAEALITSGMVATNTATITQAHDWTVSRGGVLPIFSAAQLATLAPYAGQVIYDDTLGCLKHWNGVEWIIDGEFYTGNEEVILGSTPPAGTKKQVQQGSIVGTTSAGGTLTIPFPDGTFPNGLVAAVVSPGNSAGSVFQLQITSSALNQIVVTCRTQAGVGVQNTAGVRINYILYGW